MKKGDNNTKYIPENDELEVESDFRIDVKNDKNNNTGQVKFPEIEDDYALGGFKADIAQQVGRFSDQVHIDSPAAEAGSIGQDALKSTIKASYQKINEKKDHKGIEKAKNKSKTRN